MRITIISDDGVVGVDGVFRVVDLSSLDPAIRAIQFDTNKGVGEIEHRPEATVEVDVRDEEAEQAQHRKAGKDREALAALKPIMKKARARRGNAQIADFSPYERFVDLWKAAGGGGAGGAR